MPVDGYCFQSSTAIYIRRPVEGYAGLIDPGLFVRPTVRPTHWVRFEFGVGWSIRG